MSTQAPIGKNSFTRARACLALIVELIFVLSIITLPFGAASSLPAQPWDNSSAAITDIPADAATLTVTNTNDSGPGSLRAAITSAASGDTIGFDPTFFSTVRTILLTSGELAIGKNLTVQGPGANLLTVSGNNGNRVFDITSGAFTVGLSGMKITGGNGVSGGFAGPGGGILNNFGTLTLTGSTVSGNTAVDGAGIYNGGTLTVIGSTISDNTVTSATGSGDGGGIDNIGGTVTIINTTISGNRVTNGDFNGGAIASNLTVNITNSTITNNSATGPNSGSGIYRSHGSVTLRNSIVAGNVTNSSTPDIVSSGGGSILSNGYNLIGNRGNLTFNGPGDQSGTAAAPLDPVLGPLANNGGPTLTHALLFGSTALDGGDNTGAGVTTDQRGLARTVDLAGIPNAGDGTDIGAYEAQTAPTGSAMISGAVAYGNAIGAPTPHFVSNVLISGAGSPNVSTTTSFPSGTYTLTGFGVGSYTVTPSKSGGVNGITSFDAALIAQYAAGIATLNGNQLIVADVSGNGTVSSFDAALIARYVASLPSSGATGSWIFSPANRNYASVTGNIPGQDFTALLMGEVSGNWVNAAPPP